MKVKDLKKFLEGKSDESVVVIRGGDHNYHEAAWDFEEAVNVKGELSETHSGDSRYPHRFTVLVFW